MCGPLACALIPTKRSDPLTQQGLYHAGRVVGYSLLGLLAGALAAMPLALLGEWTRQLLPWALVAFFLIIALRLERWVPKSLVAARLFHPAAAKLRRMPEPVLAFGFGLLTPLLPCGPLYALVALAAFTGEPVRGAEFLFAFAVGTVPLLWFAQNRMGWIQERLGVEALARIRVVLALGAALLITWRMRASFGLPGPSVDSFLCG